LSAESKELLDADPRDLSPYLLEERATLQRRVDAALRANALLARLDEATVDSTLAPDCRRMLSQESNTLRAAAQRGNAEHTGIAVIEAERVLEMWAKP
jgi:hypothetical protein